MGFLHKLTGMYANNRAKQYGLHRVYLVLFLRHRHIDHYKYKQFHRLGSPQFHQNRHRRLC